MTPHPITLPTSLKRQTRFAHLGPKTPAAPAGIPALLAHPDWSRPAPTVIWLHGRTVSKELDNGRYLRYIRAGIAACAIDLPGHGERYDAALHSPANTLDLLSQAIAEIDIVVEALADPHWSGCFDLDRLAIGGMSAGGMAVLRRLCDPGHPFICAAVEGTSGNLGLLYHGSASPRSTATHPIDRVRSLDPIHHLANFRPIPLLALHSVADAIVPLACITTFLDALTAHYKSVHAPIDLITLKTWLSTGAPQEHNGFGRAAAEAKIIHTDFLSHHLLPRTLL